MANEVMGTSSPAFNTVATICSLTLLTSGAVMNNLSMNVEPIPVIGEASSNTDYYYRVDGPALPSNVITITNRLQENLDKLEEIKNLPDNWNGNNADAFPGALISKVKDIILGISIQPEVFPTAADSIQLEYDGPYNSYLEFQISNKELADVFIIDSDGKEREFSVSCSIGEIDKVVKKFYG